MSPPSLYVVLRDKEVLGYVHTLEAAESQVQLLAQRQQEEQEDNWTRVTLEVQLPVVRLLETRLGRLFDGNPTCVATFYFESAPWLASPEAESDTESDTESESN